MQRRTFLQGSLSASILAATRPLWAAGAVVPAADAGAPLARLAALEQAHGGRLGVSILDVETGRRIDHRGDERFPMCSTFKLLLVSAVLARVDRGELSLAQRVEFAESDLVSYSPVTKSRTGTPGMTLAGICEAAITLSDNTAANLLLDRTDGPAGWTAFARTLGDVTSRLDRRETMLNEATPGDPRDTTTPAAMAADMQAVLLGDVLSASSRSQLLAWLEATGTGKARIRAGLPAGWRAGDKTGTSNNAVFNDIAIAWPPGRKPILVTAYYAETPVDADTANAVLAEVGRIAGSLTGP
ncbi:MAG: class A beta-lactamase [Pseudomonadota bacterium]|nr:class A beta-lactamase [Pseudomonadota bacterium]